MKKQVFPKLNYYKISWNCEDIEEIKTLITFLALPACQEAYLNKALDKWICEKIRCEPIRSALVPYKTENGLIPFTFSFKREDKILYGFAVLKQISRDDVGDSKMMPKGPKIFGTRPDPKEFYEMFESAGIVHSHPLPS